MTSEFSSRFLKDISKLTDAAVKSDIAGIIEAVEAASQLDDIPNLKKLKGFKTAYRIRSGDYRIGIFINGSVIEFARAVHRRDIYRLFP
jgi:mRNA interferase RelE/StbE